MSMTLLERLHPTQKVILPEGARIGLHWGALARQRRTGVGIDIGGGTVKIVQIRWTRTGARLENYALVPLPGGIMQEGIITAPGAVTEVLKATYAAMGLEQDAVGTTVGGPAILHRYITLPKVSPEELRSAMKFEAPQHLPIPEDELIYDFTPVPEATGIPEHQMGVFLAGTSKKLVDGVLNALNQSGARTTAIELDCLAILRALEALGLAQHRSQQPLVLMDFGETSIRISVIRYGVPMLARTIPTGLSQLRSAVAEALHVVPGQAEDELRLKGLKGDKTMAEVVDPWVTELLDSVGRSVEFFLIQNRNAALDKVFVVGGGAVLPDLPELLTTHLKTVLNGRPEAEQLKVQRVGLAGLDINPELQPGVNAVGPLLITALGSALREGEEDDGTH
ncbi:MAG: type IV pilus assembly protein PilM [Mycobacterium leprae]